MIVGFSGTRRGMTQAQRLRFRQFLVDVGATRLVHGGCYGSDAEAHEIAISMGLEVFVRPSMYVKTRAKCDGAKHVYEPDDALVRNAKIVADADVMTATPAEFNGVLRSGTWHTIRCAKRAGKEAHVINPDGQIVLGGYMPKIKSGRSTVRGKGQSRFSDLIKSASIVLPWVEK